MKRVHYVAIYRSFFALLTFFALSFQLGKSISSGASVANFFSFFTVQSNILAGGLLVVLAYSALVNCRPKHIDFWHGAITSYMVVVGVIYALLLSGSEAALQTPVWWVNLTLHYIMPIVMLADWSLHIPHDNFSYRQSAEWLVYPVMYGIYSLLRGYHTDWYPYPFLNPLKFGYSNVVLLAVPILLTIYGIIVAVTKIHMLRAQAAKPNQV